MEIYNYIQETFNFEIDNIYEVTKDIKENICNHFNISLRKLGDELSNPQLFELTKKYEGSKDNRKWIYYITLFDVQQPDADLRSANEHHYDIVEYLNLKVIFKKINDFINVSDLCKQNNTRFADWSRLDHSQTVIEHFEKKLNIKVIERDETYRYRGTYMHKDLVVHLAIWISVDFAFKVSKIVNEYIDKENKLKLIEKDNIIKGKDHKIDELSTKIDNLLVMNTEIKSSNEKLIDINNKQSEDIQKLLSNSTDLFEQNKTTQTKLDQINNLLNKLNENILPEDSWTTFRIYKMNINTYHVVRVMTKNLQKTNKDFEEYEKLFEFSLPSSVQFFSSFRNKYRKNYDINRNDLKLNGKSENELLYHIKTYYAEILKNFIEDKDN